MRSPSASLLLAVTLTTVAAATPAATVPTAEQVRTATEAVYQDPDLHGLKLDRKLRFKPDDAPPRPADRDSGRWLIDLARWLADTGRWLVWLLGAAAVAVLAVYLKRWIAVRGDAVGGRTLVLPSHVQDLDIRPESLPDDVGAAVRGLWQRGEARPALSLLYRGALSRLVHEHAVPVHGASTEAECVALASRHLGAESSAFVERLVGLWQRAVYGAHLPDAAVLMQVCDEFATRLPRHRRIAAPPGKATA